MENEKKILVISVDSKMASVLQKVGRDYVSINGGEILAYHLLELPYSTPISQDFDIKDIIPEDKYNEIVDDFNDIPHMPTLVMCRDIKKEIKDKVIEIKPDLLISDFDKIEKLKLDKIISKKIVIYDVEKSEDKS